MTYNVYLVDKETNQERYVATHRKEKDAEAHGRKERQARSPKRFDYVVRPTVK